MCVICYNELQTLGDQIDIIMISIVGENEGLRGTKEYRLYKREDVRKFEYGVVCLKYS